MNRRRVDKNLVQRGDIYYYCKGDDETPLGRFPSEAKAIEAKALFEAQHSFLGRASFQWRANDCWCDYIDEREKQMNGLIPYRRQISELTFKEMKDVWRLHLARYFGSKKLAEIDDVLWNKCVKRVEVKDPSNLRKVLGTFLRWCKSEGRMRVLPELKLEQRKRRKRKVLTEDQIKAILSNSEGSLLLFVSMYLFMGVRWSEQLRLNWKNVNLVEGWILIDEETSRTRRGREIPLNGFVRSLLAERLKEHQATIKPGMWVYPNRGNPKEHMVMTGPMKAWHTMLEKAGLADLDIRPHDLRATFEHFMHLNTAFTDTQREKMAGASIDVQKRIYLTGFQARHLRGLEEVVTFEGIENVLTKKI